MALRQTASLLLICVLSPSEAQPSLTGFSLNLTPPEQLLLTFSENVQETCNPSSAFLRDSNMQQPNVNIPLMGTCNYNAPSIPTVLLVNVDPQVWAEIQGDTSLATSASNTYLSLNSGFVSSIANDPNTESLLQVTQFTSNTNPPILQGCIIDQTSRIFGLMFTEGVLTSSVVITGITVTFLNSGTNMMQTYALTGGQVMAFGQGTSQVGIVLSENDFSVLIQGSTNASDYSVTLAANSATDGNGQNNMLQTGVPVFSVVAEAGQVPMIVSFTPDFTGGTIDLAFSVPSQNFVFDQIYVTNQSAPFVPSQSYSLTGSNMVVMLDQATIQVQITTALLNALLSDSFTCTDIQNCYIFWQNGSFVDINGSPTIEPAVAVQAGAIIFNVDTTPPVLMEFGVNLLVGNLTLTFSEPVFGDVLDVSGLILTDGFNRQERITGTVDTTTIPMTGLSTMITIIMSSESLDFAKLLQIPRLAAYSNTTTDNSGNQLTSIGITNALTPTTLVADTTPPVLLAFQPSPQDRNIVMMFDERVNLNSWNESLLSLTLQVASGDFIYNSFSGGSVSSDASQNLTYTFSVSMFTSPFSDQFAEASTMGTVLLNVQPGLVADVSGNSIDMSAQLRYSVLPPDTTRPSIASFTLDMNTGTLLMTFSEPVSLSPAGGLIQLYDQSDFGSVTLRVYTLTDNGTYLGLQNGPSPTVSLLLGVDDLNAIKANRQLCINQATTFLGAFPSLGQDRSGNLLQPASSGLPASGYVPDTTAPNVLSWGLDLNAGELRIQFSEAIARESFSYNNLVLTPTMSSQQGVTLPANAIAQYLESDATTALTLPDETLNGIKSNRQLCTQSSDCFLFIPQTTYRDTNGNLPAAAATLPVGSIIPDTISPRLIAYTLNLDTGRLTLTFSEPVDVNSFNPTSFNFMTPPGSSVVLTHSISDSSVVATADFDSTLNIQLGPMSLNQVKYLAVTTSSNFGAVVSSSFITDNSGNAIVSIEALNSLLPQSVIPDSTNPQLVRFLPQFPSASDITFYFNEAVNITSFQINSLTISLTTLQGTFTYSGFSEGTVNASADRSAITYTFSSNELNSTLSSQYTEASQRGSISLTASSSFVMDLFLNPLFAITNSNPIVFTTDTERPTVMTFNLDLDRGLINLSFSEPVNINPNPLLVRIQNAATSPTSNVTLTGFSSIIPDNTVSDSKMIFLTNADSLTLATNQIVATMRTNTYLILLEDFVSDVSGNLISPNASAVQVSTLILDTTGPSIISSQLDLNQGSLQLDFSELIDSEQLMLSQIYITGTASLSPTGYNIVGSSASTTMNYISSVTFQLPSSTLTTIKADLQVCSSNSNCFVFVSSGAINDASGNQNAVSNRNITSIIDDIGQPTLTSYSLDLNVGSMVITFSEPILTTSLDTSQITLLVGQSSQSLQQVTVAGYDSSNSVVRLSFGTSILNLIKRLASMGSLMLSMSSNAATDTSNNIVVAIPPVNARLPSPFTRDSTPPLVINFIPSSGGQLTFTLVFDEFVLASTLQRSQLSFQLRGREGQFDFTDLSAAMVTDLDDRIVLTFPPSETRFSPTNTTFQNAYLSSYSFGSVIFVVVPGFIADISNNIYNGPLTFTFTNSSDTERPRLTNFTLDLNTGELTLMFSEDVNILTVVGNAAFGSAPISSSLLLGIIREPQISTPNSSPVSSTAFLQLSSLDVDSIVATPSIGTSTIDTYLYLQEQFAVDSSGNYLDTTRNIQAGEVIQRVVIIQPQLVSFDLFNLDNRTMVLTFNLPVDISTLDITQVTLYSGLSLFTSTTFNLTGGNFSYANDNQTSLAIVLTAEDIRAIKQVPGLATANDNTYVRISNTALVDSQGSPVLATPIPIPLTIGGFIPDTTGPSLMSYTFNLTSQLVTLTFSDPVVPTSFDATQLTIQNSSSLPSSSSYTLTSGVATSLSDPMVLQVSISDSDYNAILSMLDLATSPSNTFISFTSQLVRDTDGNNVLPITPSNAPSPDVFVPDTVPPSILSFSLDMNNGQLQLTFSEPLLSSSLYLSELTLQNAPSPTSSLSLANETMSSLLSPTTNTLVIQLSEDSLNFMKSADGYSAISDSFISPTTLFASDTSGNSIISAPVQSTTYTQDSVRPSLIAFDLNVNQGNAIYLNFSEAITFPSNNVVMTITLQDQGSNPSISRTLTTDNIITILPSLTNAEVRLGDFNLVRELIADSVPIASSAANLYISLTATNGFRDFAGNDIVPILSTNAQRVRYYYRTCFNNQFNSISEGTCESCSSLCAGSSCSGAASIAGSGGCDRCYAIMVNNDNTQDRCLPQNTAVPPFFYVEQNTSIYSAFSSNVYRACHEECATCNGPLSTDCSSCRSSFTRSNVGDVVECVSSCPQGSSSSSCGTCHAQCLGCHGPSSQQCQTCREDSIVVDNILTCVPQCGNGTYRAPVGSSTSNFECRNCHSLCLNCTGPNLEDCYECRGASEVINGRLTCLQSCPTNTYKASNGSCLPCHKLCSGGCTGSSNRDCSSCVDITVSVSATVSECVRSCPSGREYNSITDNCQYTQTIIIVIIVCSIVGGILLLLLLGGVLFCVYWCFSSRGRFAPEDKEVALLGKSEKPEIYEKSGLTQF